MAARGCPTIEDGLSPARRRGPAGFAGRGGRTARGRRRHGRRRRARRGLDARGRPWRSSVGRATAEVLLTIERDGETLGADHHARASSSARTSARPLLAGRHGRLPARRQLQRQRRGRLPGGPAGSSSTTGVTRFVAGPARRPGRLRRRGRGHRQPVHRGRPRLLGGGRRRQRQAPSRRAATAWPPIRPSRWSCSSTAARRPPARSSPGRCRTPGGPRSWASRPSARAPSRSGPAARRERRLPPVGRQVADARQDLDPRGRPRARRRGGGGGERFWATLGDEVVDAAAAAADPQLQRAISILLGEPTPAARRRHARVARRLARVACRLARRPPLARRSSGLEPPG